MKWIFFIAVVVCAFPSFAQLGVNKQLLKSYKTIIAILTQDSLQGRASSTIYEAKTALYISNEFRKIKGFNPIIQPFNFKTQDSVLRNSKNIYCHVNNNADSTILIGAHYDHLGMGEGRSRTLGKKGIHPGADDNASGIALMFGLARRLKSFAKKKYNYVFVAYSAHEVGLYGSSNFSEFAKVNFKPITLVLNFDMVGRLDDKTKVLNIYGAETLHTNKNKIDSLTFNGKIYTNHLDVIFQTDAKTFVKQEIQCLSFTTGVHNDYHKISDTAEKINYRGILQIQKFIEKLILFF